MENKAWFFMMVLISFLSVFKFGYKLYHKHYDNYAKYGEDGRFCILMRIGINIVLISFTIGLGLYAWGRDPQFAWGTTAVVGSILAIVTVGIGMGGGA